MSSAGSTTPTIDPAALSASNLPMWPAAVVPGLGAVRSGRPLRIPHIHPGKSHMPAVTVEDTLQLPRVPALTTQPAAERSVRSVTTAPQGYEGEGFPVRRAFAGVDWTRMGMGPIPASEKALERAGMTADDLDAICEALGAATPTA